MPNDFFQPRAWGANLVPTGKLAVDKSHRFANGLIACFVPGIMGGVDISGFCPATTVQTLAPSMTQEGLGSACVFSTVIPPSFKSWPGFTIYFRGLQTAAPNAFNAYVEITYDNIGSSPFSIAAIADAGDNTNMRGQGNNGSGSFTQGFNLPRFTSGFRSLACRFIPGGNGYELFVNGISQQTAAGNLGNPPSSTATSTLRVNGNGVNAICTIACVWNRSMTNQEMADYDAAPYDILVPNEAEMSILQAVAATQQFTLMGQAML